MPAGFQAFTDTGVFQIDGESVNFGFRQHAVCTTSDGGAGFNTLYPVATQLTFAAQSPVVAIYAPGEAVALLACKENGDGTWTATFCSPVATSFDVYIFDAMSACPPSGSRCGLQAFNSQGVLIADSAIPFLKVLGAGSGDLNVPPSSTAMQGGGTYTQQWTFGVARAATVVGVTATAYAAQGLTNPSQRLGKVMTMMSAWRHAGGVVSMAAVYSTSRVIPLSNPILTWRYTQWSGIFVDVSNL
ncbi:hypothetical protein [Burkholderia multivorans]|uniref:hypothetical protein n=1 Tax=Burkholderia multivorans TaxID=87883 RepID=UPI0021C1FECC|nr:hypothetical protein [Burkholderia multivorans]